MGIISHHWSDVISTHHAPTITKIFEENEVNCATKVLRPIEDFWEALRTGAY